MAKAVRKSHRHYRIPITRDEVPDVTVTPKYAYDPDRGGRYEMTQEEVNAAWQRYPSMEERIVEQWEHVRLDRDMRLRNTDWTACRSYDQGVPDVDWAIYRQLLRDIPQDFAETPWDIDWPIAPDGTGGDDGEGHAMDDMGNVIYDEDEDGDGGD